MYYNFGVEVFKNVCEQLNTAIKVQRERYAQSQSVSFSRGSNGILLFTMKADSLAEEAGIYSVTLDTDEQSLLKGDLAVTMNKLLLTEKFTMQVDLSFVVQMDKSDDPGELSLWENAPGLDIVSNRSNVENEDIELDLYVVRSMRIDTSNLTFRCEDTHCRDTVKGINHIFRDKPRFTYLALSDGCVADLCRDDDMLDTLCENMIQGGTLHFHIDSYWGLSVEDDCIGNPGEGSEEFDWDTFENKVTRANNELLKQVMSTCNSRGIFVTIN